MSKDFNHSYWEIKQHFKLYDLIVIGSGIVGLSTAISFKKRNPRSKILILEKGLLPDGASTKNAGFACFGSPGELLDDLSVMPDKIVWETVKMRWDGLQLLRKRLKDKNIDYRPYGGYELFDTKKSYEYCLSKIGYLNKEITRVIGIKNCYREATSGVKRFKTIEGVLLNKFEGQIDTALMMQNLILMARKNGISLLNGIEVSALNETNNQVELETNLGDFKASRVVVATNGFARSLLKIKDVNPARAQVLITKPIDSLKIKGTFHFLKGYYYFRNIDNRILFGGGRNLDIVGETTEEQGLNNQIQKQLDKMLKEIILPHTDFEVQYRWSGIMGVGSEKRPIIKFVGKNILAAVRMGGMGIAIGSWVGEKSAEELS